MKCDVCNVNEAVHFYDNFGYKKVCKYCHDSPTLYFPDKPIDLEKESLKRRSLWGFL